MTTAVVAISVIASSLNLSNRCLLSVYEGV